MAIGRMEAKVVSRGNGHSAVAKAAYNAREALMSERYDKREDYSRKGDDCLFRGFYAPKDAPEWAQDRERFWNAVEWREKRKDAQLGREFEIALPAELTAEQNRWLLQDFVRENFTRNGYVADVAIHAPDRDGDQRNIHAHVFVPLRKLEEGHWAEKKERTSKLEKINELKELRARWEKLTNRHLERHGFNERIDMRSYAEQGVDRTPGVHMGKQATRKERRGEASELGDRNRAVANQNRQHEDVPDIEEARERAAYRRQQREGFRQQDAERANATWEAADGSTLSNARKRDREAGDSRSTEHEARRAMDDLASTDPHGTARHFGHHAGDRLKSPEDMRRENAERMRGFAADPQPDLANEKPLKDPTEEKQHQAQPADPTAQRRAWAERLRAMDTEGLQQTPEKPTRTQERVMEPEAPVPPASLPSEPVDSRRLAGWRTRAIRNNLIVEQCRNYLQSRWFEWTFGRKRYEKPVPLPTVDGFVRQKYDPDRPKWTPMQVNIDDRETFETVRGVMGEDTRAGRRAVSPQPMPQEHQPEPSNANARAPRSRSSNRDFADELLAQAREQLAKEEAAGREIAREIEKALGSSAHDERARIRENNRIEAERVRELLRQERQARRPPEP